MFGNTTRWSVGDNPVVIMPTAPSIARVVASLLLPLGLSACAVVSVAGAAAGAAISIGGAVVSTGIKVTGAVIEKTVDVVAGDDETLAK